MSLPVKNKKPVSAGFLFWCAALALSTVCASLPARAQDYEREKRWADDVLSTLVVGEAAWLTQKNGHKFLALHTEVLNSRGVAIIAHGRGWSPDYELYGALRTKLAEAGYSTLSIQLPVLGGTAKLIDYIQTYPDARERFQIAVDYLRARGNTRIAIVSHSLGATMANQYLIKTEDTGVKAWVFISIINGLEEMFRIKIPVLDVFGGKDWDTTLWGADERLKQITKVPGSRQAIVADAGHFFEGREDALARTIAEFLDSVLR